jgi:hypothetical protein
MGEKQDALLLQLREMKRCYGPGCVGTCEALLEKLQDLRYPDVESLVRAHDDLLFLRAFPQSERVAKLADSMLANPQVEKFVTSPDAADILDDESVSGIAGTTVTNTWTLDLAVQLAARHAAELSARWNVDEHYRRIGLTLPSLLPLLDDDSSVEADTPYLKWIQAALGPHESDLQWLLRRFATLPVPAVLRTSLFAGLGVEIAWNLHGSLASRSLARRTVKKLFTHQEPLLQRSQVSLAAEVASPPLAVRRLSPKDGKAIIGMVQDAVTVRYRELQGTTYGDPARVLHADAGRGVQLFLWGLDGGWRLPLRAYYAGLALRNGVPINYFEAIGLFEWMEVGFNTFYAYREGETAWTYAQYLRLLHQVAGVNCISVYPYQIGQDNEEAIQSGAFWFYRKLGFRPGRPDLLALTEREERKMARDPGHRTSARTLRKLADGHIFFEFGGAPVGRWDTFSTRTVGIAVQRKMASEFGGDAAKMRRRCERRLWRVLGVDPDRWTARERWALSNFAVVLSLVKDLTRWTPIERRLLTAILRAKAGRDETTYLRLLQGHDRLREAFLRIGSEENTPPV